MNLGDMTTAEKMLALSVVYLHQELEVVFTHLEAELVSFIATQLWEDIRTAALVQKNGPVVLKAHPLDLTQLMAGLSWSEVAILRYNYMSKTKSVPGWEHSDSRFYIQVVREITNKNLHGSG